MLLMEDDRSLMSMTDEELRKEVVRLRTGIREHHDRIINDKKLYDLLPEKEEEKKTEDRVFVPDIGC